MHIPNEMIEGSICPITTAVSAVGITSAAYFASKSKEKPTAARFGAITAFIFAAQMMNFPILDGTSGNLIGATLGVPFGVLAISIVLAIQCLVFSDGGLSVLGANILNMAIIGSISGAIIHKFFFKKQNKNKVKDYIFLGFAAWLSVVLAALACSIELGISGTIESTKVIPAMIGVHAIIGIGEGIITVAAFSLFASRKITAFKKVSFGMPLLGAGIVGLMLSPFASGYPDGLEWIAEKYNFLHEAAPIFVSPLPDYTVPLINNGFLTTGLAGLLGVLITFFITFGIGKALKPSRKTV